MSTEEFAPASPIHISASGRALPSPRAARGFLLIAIAFWLFAATIGLAVMTKWAVLQNSDLSIDSQTEAWGTSSEILGDWALAWQHLGSPPVSVVLVALFVGGLLVAKRFGWALFVLASAFGGVLIAVSSRPLLIARDQFGPIRCMSKRAARSRVVTRWWGSTAGQSLESS